MANLTTAELTALDKILSDAFDVDYAETLASSKYWVGRHMAEFSIDNRSMDMPFRNNDVGIRVGKEFEAFTYQTVTGKSETINLEKVMGAMEIPILDFGNSYYQDMYLSEVNGMATQMAYWPQDRVAEILNNGDNVSLWPVYDGQALYSATHDIKGNSWGNLVSGAGSELTTDSLNTALDNMQKIPAGPDGTVLRLTGLTPTLVVPPKLYATAREIVFNTMNPNQNYNTENVFKGIVDIEVEPLLSAANPGGSDTAWYLVYPVGSVKAFNRIYQPFDGGSIVSETDPKDECVKEYDKYRWSIKTWQSVGPGQFYCHYKSLGV